MPAPLRDHLATWVRHRRPHQVVLAVTAWAETATLVVLLVNIVTVHSEGVTSTVGPLHGGLYLLCSAAVVAARWVRGWSWFLVVLGLLPAVGAVIALEKLRREGAGLGLDRPHADSASASAGRSPV